MTGTTATASQYVGRFAPSPTGPLHLGSLFAALVSFLDARFHTGTWLVRIEDIDPPREVAGASQAILRSLEAHALHWDGEVHFQRNSTDRILAAIEALRSGGHTYFCGCARRRLLADGLLNAYPGLCRDRNLPEGALRVIVTDEAVSFDDRWQGHVEAELSRSPGDFVIRRRDGLFAYQLAVVVDDAWQGVTHVVRGIDLLDSTPRQLHLQSLLNLQRPDYAHFPVIEDRDGQKLSKQTGALGIDDQLASQNLARCLALLGMPAPVEIHGAPAAEIVAWACSQYDPRHPFGDHPSSPLRE